MRENHLSPLEIYMNRVFKILILGIPSVALCAGLTFTMLHLLGFYPSVPLFLMIIFDCTCVIYTLTGFLFYRHCEDADGQVKLSSLKAGKVFIAIMIFIQWNFMI